MVSLCTARCVLWMESGKALKMCNSRVYCIAFTTPHPSCLFRIKFMYDTPSILHWKNERVHYNYYTYVNVIGRGHRIGDRL